MKIILVVLFCAALAGCVSPKVNVSPAFNEQGDLEIHLAKNFRVNSFSSLSVWEEGNDEYLWYFSFGQDRRLVLKFGEETKWSEKGLRFPPYGTEPDLPTLGQAFFIEVSYVWDKAFPPVAAVSGSTFRFKITEDRNIVNYGRIRNGTQRPSSDNLIFRNKSISSEPEAAPLRKGRPDGLATWEPVGRVNVND